MMNVTFTLLQGTGDGREMRLDIYNPAHGTNPSHEERRKTAFRIEQPAADDNPNDIRKFTETMVLMTKQEARAIASALMGAAAEL